MASGRMDLILSPIPANVVYMTMNGLGDEDRGLAAIGSGTTVTLQHGRHRQSATLHFRGDGECFANYMEMNAKLARGLQLKQDRRYKLNYRSAGKLLTIEPLVRSSASAQLRDSAALSPGSVYLGYALRSILGIPERRGLQLLLRRGELSRKLSVYTPRNQFDWGFRLAPSIINSLRFKSGTNLLLTYDQSTQTLTVSDAGPPKPGPKATTGGA